MFQLSLNYSGQENNAQCSFAGLSVYSFEKEESYQETSTICESFNGLYKYRPIIANSSSAIFVVYSYKEYGTFNLQLLVSATKCKLRKIHTCDDSYQPKKEFSIPEEGCLIVQPVYTVYYTDKKYRAYPYILTTLMHCQRRISIGKITNPGRAILCRAVGYLVGK